MKIKMDSLVITEYCSCDKRKFHFIKEISDDQLIKNFISRSINEWLEDSENVDELLIGPAYIIADQRKLVGIIRLAHLDPDGTLDLHYGVHPDYRRQHYGTRILKEVSKYVFKNLTNVNRIELHINEINKGSIQYAENAQFIYQDESDQKQEKNKIRVYAINK